MKIKTNLNKVNQYHDTVNFDPIEVQVRDYIVSTGLFKDVKYKTTKDNKYFILDGETYLGLRYDNYSLVLGSMNDTYHLMDSTDSHGKTLHTIEYAIKEDSDTLTFLKNVKAIKAANVKADEIVNELLKTKDLNEKIEASIDKYFKSKLLVASFGIFKTNLIPSSGKYYAKGGGDWCWLHFHLKGIKQLHSTHDKSVGVEVFADGKIKDPRVDRFVSEIQCTDSSCKPSLKVMQSRLAEISRYEEKVVKFDGTKIPYLQDYLATLKKGSEFKKNFKLTDFYD